MASLLRIVLTFLPAAAIVILLLVLRCLLYQEVKEAFEQVSSALRPITTYFGLSAPAPPRMTGHQNVPRRSFMENLQSSTGASFLLKTPSRVIDV